MENDIDGKRELDYPPLAVLTGMMEIIFNKE